MSKSKASKPIEWVRTEWPSTRVTTEPHWTMKLDADGAFYTRPLKPKQKPGPKRIEARDAEIERRVRAGDLPRHGGLERWCDEIREATGHNRWDRGWSDTSIRNAKDAIMKRPEISPN